VTLQLAMSLFNHTIKYTNLQNLRQKFSGFSGLCSNIWGPVNLLILGIMVQTTTLCFAQEAAPEKIAIYVYGAGDAGINKSLSSKLLVTMTQSGEYAAIANPNSFQDELAKGGNGDIAQISQAAKRHGADYVCAVNIIEAFGAHSITALLLKISTSQVVKTGSTDRSLKSLEDLTAVSNELAVQLLTPSVAVPLPAAVVTDTVPSEAVQKQCNKMYNINELIFKIKNSFPTQLKDCSSKLAKDMLTPASLGGKKLGEPKQFLTQCSVDGVKKELPDGFPNVDKILGSITNFVQGILNTALAGGGLDPKKLVSAVASMNVMELVNDVKKLAADECVVDEPYEPPAATAENVENNSSKENENGVSFGIRAGFNLSHTYSEYKLPYYGSGSGDFGNIFGMQLGFVVDFAPSSWFHIQPGLMYVQKGMEDKRGETTAHYIELPLLLSLKLSAFRLNAGPYLGLCVSKSNAYVFGSSFDFGLSAGIGFDIGMFYIGSFYDYGLTDISSMSGYSFYNRTLGFNVGINL